MAMKPFEIQGADLKLGGVTLQAGNSGVVIPGVTQATSYTVEEIKDSGEQDRTFNTTPRVIDVIIYNDYIDHGSTAMRASYTVELDDDGYIDEIEVDEGGVYLVQDYNIMMGTNPLYAYIGTAEDPFITFVSADWVTIPFRVKMRAGEVETIGGAGASALADLNDVQLDGPAEGQVLTWNNSQEKWENRDASSGSADTGDITFSNGYMTGTDSEIRMQTLNVQQTASYNFTPGNGDYFTAVWDGTGITFNDPTQSIYDAIWALTGLSTIEVQVGGNWFTVTYSGSSTPGMPQAPTLFVNESAVNGPLNIDVVDIVINQGTSSYVEIDGTDFRVDVQDDIRIYGNDTFILYNRSTSDPIRIQTNDGNNTWGFEPDGSLTLPDNGDIIRNGTSVIPSLATVATTGNYTDLSDRPSLLYRQVYAPATSTGQSGDLMHDIAFGGDYVYYCTQNYNAGYQVTLASGYSGGPYPYLLKGDYPQPQPGWTFVWETVTYAIVTVTDPNVGEWQLELDQTINTGAGGIITLVPPAVDIWKRVAFSVDTW